MGGEGDRGARNAPVAVGSAQGRCTLIFLREGGASYIEGVRGESDGVRVFSKTLLVE